VSRTYVQCPDPPLSLRELGLGLELAIVLAD